MPQIPSWRRILPLLGVPAFAACLAAASLAGCQGGDDRAPAAVARELAGEWSLLEERYEALQQTRQELAAKRQEKRGKASESELDDLDDLSDLSVLERRVEVASLDYSRHLATFLNDSRDAPATRHLRQMAVRRKSAEELETARRFIELAGDYRRAIEICERALELDPGNPALLAELARAREMRFVTAERFAGVREGMDPDEVKALLGPPNLHNVRELPGNIVAWFFDRDESGAAAGVWFERRKGKLSVYATDFAAVEPGAQPLPAPSAPTEPPAPSAPPVADPPVPRAVGERAAEAGALDFPSSFAR